jgi:hypothetical protein
MENLPPAMESKWQGQWALDWLEWIKLLIIIDFDD